MLTVKIETIAGFLESARGSCHHAVYVLCGSCPYIRDGTCGDFLFVPGFDCVPILLPLKDAELFFGKTIEKEDCAVMINCSTFCNLYHKWMELNLSDSRVCPVHQMLISCPKNRKWD